MNCRRFIERGAGSCFLTPFSYARPDPRTSRIEAGETSNLKPQASEKPETPNFKSGRRKKRDRVPAGGKMPSWSLEIEVSLRLEVWRLRLCHQRFVFAFCHWRFYSIFPGVDALDTEEIRRAVKSALAEDIGSGDVTTLATVPEEAVASALLRAREPIVVCGLALAEAAFHELSPEVKIARLVKDGHRVTGEATLMNIAGPARALLSAERVALNFVQRLSGVATLTAQFVDAIKGTAANILDTRKTTPGWRRFEKYAVACGGGKNHRLGLSDMVLIKDNHLAALRHESPSAIAAAVQRARSKYPRLKVEVEADTLEQVEQALAAGADLILLDNMNLVQLRLAVQKCQGRAQTEASGGVTLAGVKAIADTGVDFISVGALTHSARAVDIALDFQP
jgi:nicotinate-nucleotide pyrophosphorylase (carboxylating)